MDGTGKPSNLPKYGPVNTRTWGDVASIDLQEAEQCWALWEKRQELAGSDTDRQRGRLAIETHLARIAQHRPLAGIADSAQRAEADQVRRWFQEEMVRT